MAELALEQTLDIGDYLAAFRRRRTMISLVAGGVFLLGLITALVWPPTYRSSATILIEEQDIPNELVQTTVTSYAAERIQIINQRVMSRTNLLKIIEQYSLYERARRLNPIEEVLSDMRADINMDMINADVVDPRSGRPTTATIAFTVGFESDSPQTALKVANELTTLYLDENLKSRTEKAAETYDFLTVEASRLNDTIGRLEQSLAEFKETNINTLPELRELNTQILERTEREISDTDTQIRGLEERKVYLGGQLAVLDPYGSTDTLSPSARLSALRTEQIRLSSRYTPDHPDVSKVTREIRALELETGQPVSTDDLQAQLRVLRDDLESAEQSYSADHPDVKSLKRQITALENTLGEIASEAGANLPPGKADNPAYIGLNTQLNAADTEIRSLKSKRTQLIDKMAEYEARLAQTPKSEQKFQEITRDLENSTSRYQDIRAKQMTAEVAQSMEKERKGEKFTLIDPAILPEEPISPNRGAIIFLSLVLALGAGVGSTAVSKGLSNAVSGAKSLTMVLQMAPLSVIPYLASQTETRAQRRRRNYVLAALAIGIIVALLLVHLLISPIDVMWFRGMRQVDKLVGE
jgi:uncharacterized protein involved in exopolysaccharide biosynthesis